jgi:D-beta-D-heptose 7-phosphate kinase/D-beta-D-heptose 1-phosphate adenosyltransferase
MEFLKNISNLNVLIIGDIMLDRYWWGSVSRISPEAPVPVINLEKVSLTPGGAANVAANVAGLGAKTFLVGVLGEDKESDLMLDILETKNVTTDFLMKSPTRQTTVKTRILAQNQQIARVDQETKANLSVQEEDQVWNILPDLISEVQVVVISDYAKGMITENLLKRLITKCNDMGKKILIDPKGKSYGKYTGATLITPNRHEIADACNLEDYSQALIEDSGEKLLNQLSLEYLLVTQGADGMTLFQKNKEIIHLPVELRNVYDVTGAGDTVIACLAVAIGSGATFLEAAKFANRAAGMVVEQVGTTAISLEMLNQS